MAQDFDFFLIFLTKGQDLDFFPKQQFFAMPQNF